MTETGLVNAIMQQLRRRRVYVVKVHGGPYQQLGLPDLWCVVEGRTVCMEVKLPNGKVSRRQIREVDKLRAAGAIAGIVYSVSDAMGLVDQALREHFNSEEPKQ
ncbi:MAG: VRR-NUC domain-containing protein [Planctomycetota bacterium]